ncbi:MAG: polysaccharide pyruvyl transferase family protein [Armatimonadia bacterium]
MIYPVCRRVPLHPIPAAGGTMWAVGVRWWADILGQPAVTKGGDGVASRGGTVGCIYWGQSGQEVAEAVRHMRRLQTRGGASELLPLDDALGRALHGLLEQGDLGLGMTVLPPPPGSGTEWRTSLASVLASWDSVVSVGPHSDGAAPIKWAAVVGTAIEEVRAHGADGDRSLTKPRSGASQRRASLSAVDVWRSTIMQVSGVTPRSMQRTHPEVQAEPAMARPVPAGRRVLVMRKVGLGDVVMSSVAARGAKERYPGAHVTFATSDRYQAMASHFPYVDAVADAGRVDEHDYDAAMLFDDRHRFDFAPGEGRRERLDILCELGGVAPWDRKPVYALESEEELRAIDYLRQRGWSGFRKHVGVVLSAAGRARNRSVEATSQLLTAMGKRSDLQPVLLDVRRDRVEQLNCPPGTVDTCGELSVCELAAVISHLDVLVTPDSGPLHLAAALDVPCIAFFSEVPADCRIGYYPNCVGLAKPDLCDQYPCGYVDVCRDARCINEVRWGDLEPHLNRLLDVERVTIRHAVAQPEDQSSIAMLANQLARGLRQNGLSVRQRPVADPRSAAYGNGCIVEAGGKRFALLTCDNDIACAAWTREVTERYDYLLCFSQHVYDAYRRAGVPAHRLLPFQLGLSDRLLGARPLLPDVPESTFVFFFNGICQERKNVEGLVHAFRRAFSRDEDVMLAVKSSPRAWDRCQQVLRAADSDLRATEGRRIRVYSQLWTVEQLAGWYLRTARRGAYVHPHRAGGFELPVLEALGFGARVGTTGWGGVTDYCDDHLFPYELRRSQFQVPDLYHAGGAHPKWAEPDGADIERWMRCVYEEPTTPASQQSTMLRVRRDYSWRSAARRLEWWTHHAHRRYLVFGGAGYGNLGDDAMTLALVEQLGRERCVVSSYAPVEQFPEWFHGLQVRPWGDRGAAAVPAEGLFSDVHTVAIGGHGCRWPDILEGLCRHAVAALEHGLDVVWRGIGIDEPDGHPIDRDLVRYAFETARYVGVRDSRSREILHELGVQRSVTREPDLALQLQAAPSNLAAPLLRPFLEPETQPYVVLSLNSMYVTEGNLGEWAAWVSSTIHSGRHVLCVRMCRHLWDAREDDMLAAVALRRRCGGEAGFDLLDSAVSPQLMLAIMRGADMVVGMRYHSCVFAHRVGTPTVAVSRQDKTRRFCTEHGVACLDPDHIAALSSACKRVLQDGRPTQERGLCSGDKPA